MGGLDEQLSLYYNDVDLSLRLWRAGRKVRYFVDAVVMHHRGASTKGFAKMLVLWHKNRLAYYRKHYGVLGEKWIRFVIRLRIAEERIAIQKRCKGDPQRLAAENAFLEQAQKELWAR